MKHHFSDFVRRVKIPDSSPLRKLRSILLLFIMLIGIGSAWAQDSFTITFKESGSSSDGTSQVKTIDAIIEDGAEFVSGVSATRVYNGRNGRGIKIGASSNPGTLTLTLDKQYKVYYIEVEARQYNDNEQTLKIQDQTVSDLYDVFDTYPYSYDESTWISQITIGSDTKRNYIKSITVYYETLDDIEIVGTPKTTYNEGETFDVTGLTVNYVYSDDSRIAVDPDDVTWSVDPTTLGVDDDYVTVTATVGELSAEIYPEVFVKGIIGIELVGTPKTNYNDGETFDVTGLTVNYVYSDQTTKPVTEGITWTIDGYPIDERHFDVDDHNQPFYIVAQVGTYRSDEKEDFVVTISVKAVSYIEVSGEPDKKIYQDGDEFDPTGLVVEYVYTDNTRVTVDPSDIVWSYYPDQSLSAGKTSIEVMADVNTFSSDWYMVTGLTVTATLEYIELSGTPNKTTYEAGNTFDPSGLVVEYVYSDYSRLPVDPNDITWEFNPPILSEGDGWVYVTAHVGEMSDYNSYDITVNAPAYEKITASQEDWSGEYILVYEDGNTAYVWNGADSQNGYDDAPINSNIIEKPSAAAVLTIEAITGGYSIKISGYYNNGKYLVDNGNTSALKFSDNPYAATISYESDWTKILFSQRCIRFNADDQMRFRYYSATNQQPVQLYKRIDNRADAQLAWSANSVSLKVGEAFNAPTLSYADGFDGAANIEISSDNTNLATVSAGVVSLVAETSGTATIKALFSGNDNYRPAVAFYTIHVSKTNPELEWSKSSDEIALGDAWTAPTLANPHNVAVSFESDDESVATVTSDGVISLAGGTGTAVITASFAGNAYYYSDYATYTITVNPFNPVTVRFFAPVAWGSDVKAYTWSGPYPGDYPMTSTGNGRWFICEIPENVPFLFYTGNWADQTVDMDALSANKCFTWTANREDGTNKIIPAEVADCQMDYAIAGTLPGLGWLPEEFVYLNGDDQIVFNNLPGGTYQFKINNGTWDWNLGYAYVDQANSNITLSNDNGNIQFTTTSLMNVTIAYNPANEKITVNGEIAFNPNITFGSATGSTNINTGSVSGDDNLGNTWTITTEGTTSFTPNADYAQIGSKNDPASKITFSVSLADLPNRAYVSHVAAKFGGFSSTAGDISIKVDDQEIGSGYLNGTSDVMISSYAMASGQTLSITIDDIDRAVKCYGIEYSYETYETVEVKFFAPRDESHKWEHVYAHAWNGHGTQWPGEEITASKQSNWFTYRAEKGASILFHDYMGMQTVNIDNIQSNVCYVPSAVDYNTYPMMVSLAEQCDVDYYIFGSAALIGGDADWAQGKLLEGGSITFEDVQPTGENPLVFKINIGNWLWSIGNDFLNEECASIATAGENNNIQFMTDTKQNITVSYDPIAGKICVDAELVKWPASIESYEPIEMEVNSSQFLYPQATVPENSEIKYEITEGADYISISGNAIDGYIIYANAIGTATVRAYIEESALYTAAETFFTVEVKKIQGVVSVSNMNLFVGDSETASFSTNIYGYAASDVTYAIESGNEFITVDNNGLVSALAKGNAVVRVTIAEQPLYTTATNTFTVHVSKHDGQVSAKVNPLSLKVNELKNLEFNTNITDYADEDVFFTVLSGAEHIEIDNVNRTITGISQGAAQVRITIASTATYEEATNVFTVNVSLNDGSVSAEPLSLKVNEQKAPEYVTTNTGVTPEYTFVSGDNCIEINGTEIKGIASGSAVVKIRVAANAAYTAAESLFNVSVSLNDGSVSAEPLSLKVNEQKAPEYVTSNTGVTPEYTFVSGDNCIEINGTEIKGIASGNAVVKIRVAANAAYTAAESLFNVSVSLNDGSVSAEPLSLKVNEQKAPEYVTTNTGVTPEYIFVSGDNCIEINGTEIKGIASGSAVVKIRVAANAAYTAAESLFNVSVSLNDGSVSAQPLSLKVNEQKAPEYVTTNTGVTPEYIFVSGDNCIEINGTEIKGIAEGSAVVKIRVAANAAYTAAESLFNVSVSLNDGSVSAQPLSLKVNEQKAPEYVTTNTGVTPEYIFVSGDNCIEINGTEIKGIASGSAVVKIRVAANAAYTAAESLFNVSVSLNDGSVSIENQEMMVGDQITPQFETNVPGGIANYEFVSGDDCIEINGATLTATAAGSAVLRISITGNAAYTVPNTTFTVNVSEVPEPEPVYETVREGLQIGRYYTICMPKNILAVQGASFWTMSKRNTAATLAYLEEVHAPLTAGAPYIFLAEAEKLDVVYGEETASAPAENGALRGTFDHMYQDDFNSVSAANNNSIVYMLVSNTLRIVSGGATGNHLSPNRAYVLEDAFEVVNTAPQSAPGRRVVGMPMHPNTTTGLDEDMNYDGINVQKRIIDDKLFIIVGDQMFDATGHLVQ